MDNVGQYMGALWFLSGHAVFGVVGVCCDNPFWLFSTEL